MGVHFHLKIVHLPPPQTGDFLMGSDRRVITPVTTEAMKRQVNIWITEADLEFLRQLAREREQSVSALLRRAIAGWRRDRESTREHTKLGGRG